MEQEQITSLMDSTRIQFDQTIGSILRITNEIELLKENKARLEKMSDELRGRYSALEQVYASFQPLGDISPPIPLTEGVS